MLEVLYKSSSLILAGAATFLVLTYAITSRKWYRSTAGVVLMLLLGMASLTLVMSPYTYIEVVKILSTVLKLAMSALLVAIAVAIEHSRVQAHRKRHSNVD